MVLDQQWFLWYPGRGCSYWSPTHSYPPPKKSPDWCRQSLLSDYTSLYLWLSFAETYKLQFSSWLLRCFVFSLPEGLWVSICCFKLTLRVRTSNCCCKLSRRQTNIPWKRISRLTPECQFGGRNSCGINCAAAVALRLLIRDALEFPDPQLLCAHPCFLLPAAFSLGCSNCFLMLLAGVTKLVV